MRGKLDVLMIEFPDGASVYKEETIKDKDGVDLQQEVESDCNKC